MFIISNDILIGLPGHPCKLQSLNSVACPTQSIPPLRAVCCKIRVRFWDPPSHGLLHSVHSVYGPHLQFPKNDHKLLFYIRFGKSLTKDIVKIFHLMHKLTWTGMCITSSGLSCTSITLFSSECGLLFDCS